MIPGLSRLNRPPSYGHRTCTIGDEHLMVLSLGDKRGRDAYPPFLMRPSQLAASFPSTVNMRTNRRMTLNFADRGK